MDQTINKDIAGVVVLYNPDLSMLGNIYSYIDQVSVLYVIDNSEIRNQEIVNKLSKRSDVLYLPQNENIGIAKAYNIAGWRALKEGYKYLLTMDQDSRAPDKMVQELLKKYDDNPDAGIVTPFHYNEVIVSLHDENLIEEKPYVMSSGNLINLRAFEELHGFNEDLFIDYVDIEYCLRLRLIHFKIIQANSILLIHNEGDIVRRRFLTDIIYVYNHQPIRWYYKIRNYLYLRKKLIPDYPIYFHEELIRNFKNIIKILLYEKQKYNKYKFIVRGLIDYIRGRKGRLKLMDMD